VPAHEDLIIRNRREKSASTRQELAHFARLICEAEGILNRMEPGAEESRETQRIKEGWLQLIEYEREAQRFGRPFGRG